MVDPWKRYRMVDRSEAGPGCQYSYPCCGGQMSNWCTWKPGQDVSHTEGMVYRRRIETEEKALSDTTDFKVGDKVRVRDNHSNLDGRSGLIVSANSEPNGILLVKMDGEKLSRQLRKTAVERLSGSLPEPPEGYRLLEPGKASRPCDLCRQTNGDGRWFTRHGSSSDTSQLPGYSYCRRIEQPSDEPFTLEPGKWYRVDSRQECLQGGEERHVSRLRFIGPRTNGLQCFEDGETDNTYSLMREEVIGPWTDEPTDAEIAEAVRKLRGSRIDADTFFSVYMTDGWTLRSFVDTVNEKS